MRGWTVRKVANNGAYEQRPTGYAHGSALRAAYHEGVHYHKLGYSTLFYCLRCANRIANRPIVAGSALGLLGFLFARVTRQPISLPPDVVSYLRAEQTGKIWARVLRRQRVRPAY